MSLYDTYIEQAKLVHQNDKKWRGTTVVKYIPIINEIIKSKDVGDFLRLALNVREVVNDRLEKVLIELVKE